MSKKKLKKREKKFDFFESYAILYSLMNFSKIFISTNGEQP